MSATFNGHDEAARLRLEAENPADAEELSNIIRVVNELYFTVVPEEQFWKSDEVAFGDGTALLYRGGDPSKKGSVCLRILASEKCISYAADLYPHLMMWGRAPGFAEFNLECGVNEHQKNIEILNRANRSFAAKRA